jgi:nucleotide-binding universal stress UspA family protein
MRLFGSSEQSGAIVRRVLVATDRSETAEHAVMWAAEMAERYTAELVLLQVVVPPAMPSQGMAEDLQRHAQELADERGRAAIVTGEDPAKAIIEAAETEDVDVVVVGNVGMSGRKEFLLGNVPNRVSHGTRRTVVIVNTAQKIEQSKRKRFGR